MVKHLINTGDIRNPPTVHGIPFAITLAYIPFLLPEVIPDKPPKKRNPPVNEERLNLLLADLQDWRQHIISPTQSYPHPTMILENDAIEMIRKQVREITTEDLKQLLGKCSSRGRCGHRFPQSLLTPYISGLFVEMLQSVAASSHLQPKARKPVVRHPKPRASALPCPVPKPA